MLDALCTKSRSVRHSANGANMIARGKREQREARRPWLPNINEERALKVRNIICGYFALSELHAHFVFTQGRRASRCSALAPGCHIPRLRRSAD